MALLCPAVALVSLRVSIEDWTQLLPRDVRTQRLILRETSIELKPSDEESAMPPQP